ncbi:hypothetical protein [[Phormidium] sp. ETS-05]|uniref:hypothetical protein n=1 Tax=[Phormidium] sp. ETS-05 TaxID=222819 RepID=UPI0018EEFC2F|nr:hypothetical protein [[Phormidium] sp. ETS-05]
MAPATRTDASYNGMNAADVGAIGSDSDIPTDTSPHHMTTAIPVKSPPLGGLIHVATG